MVLPDNYKYHQTKHLLVGDHFGLGFMQVRFWL